MIRFSHQPASSSSPSRTVSRALGSVSRACLVCTTGLLFASSPAFAQAQGAGETRTATDAVVYGDDDRRDVAEHPDAALRALASESIVTLVNRASLLASGNTFSIGGSLLGQSQDLCSGEAFTNQPTAGFCSGTLIGPDLVLTAGHCVTSPSSCAATSFVFDYQWLGSNVGALNSDDVYSCRSIVARQESDVTDYAVLQLDRVVMGRTPATVVDMRGSLPVGTEFAIIGSPSGLPMKIDSGGTVTDINSSSTIFYGTPDSFGGNSGSGIFRASDNALFGVLIAGETDYISDGSCNRVNICDDSCEGEQMIYAGIALDAACENMTSQALCQTPPVCGDNFCGEGESSGCPGDCDAITCGDGWCGGDEWTSCPEDCEADVTCETNGTCEDGFEDAFCAAANTPSQHWAATMTLLLGLLGVLAIRLRPASRQEFGA
ncbi:MAG: V8-like Glu-specific endopeptidase [Bradymonadia bacterium]|jgi:V8-like Glu-specific endopeptidase